jgi:hypothetical protein
MSAALEQSAPMQLAIDALDAQAARSALRMLKDRARRYRARPSSLEVLYPGLAIASPTKLIAVGEHLLERERAHPRRHFGWSGFIPALNAKACVLLGRYRRRFDRREVVQ